MARLDDWCDEAAFADWEQASEDLPAGIGQRPVDCRRPGGVVHHQHLA
jgi:hypothetical protein